MNRHQLACILVIVLLLSCQHKESSDSNEGKDSLQKGLKKGEITTGIFEFVEYEDGGDDNLLYAKKGNTDYDFLAGNVDCGDILRGDTCEIQWKRDTVRLAGDDDYPQLKNVLVSIKKIQNGNLSKFIKAYNRDLKYHWGDDQDAYSEDFFNKLYTVAQYYIANSNNQSIKARVKNKEEIEYSIEEQTRDNRVYEVLGIGYTFENHFTLMQWVYFDVENHKIYEYDLPNDKLVKFD
ncbi:hypothetical protein [Flavobacterium wongokense]|uniref:hypothetical protein n=1 Tax=Flavobacterium wongokense TaxID=2910674 RepID=UPI001F489853|nr:hypothetical protein [Flavobacterium sp. WG47]MCF6132222.1 hypothetical protein [Flavobacterium sp. WG47]